MATWLEDTRRSSLSRKMPKSRQRSRSRKDTTRKLLPKLLSSIHVKSAGRRCRIQKPSSSTSRANIQKVLFLQSWKVWKPEPCSPKPAPPLHPQRLLMLYTVSPTAKKHHTDAQTVLPSVCLSVCLTHCCAGLHWGR